MVASVGSPVGKPATSRPRLMQSISAYSSAMRVGGLVEARVEPIWTMATSWPSVSLARAAPIRLGLAMNPYTFWWCWFVHSPWMPARAAWTNSSRVQL